MATIKKIVGQITLEISISVASTTYFYLLQPSTAPIPQKPRVNPPPTISTEGYVGWQTAEPGYTYGDTKDLYFIVRTEYSDGSFEYTAPSLSSSYEAAKEAYNQAKSALDLAGETNQYFWSIPEAYDSDVPAGAWVTSQQQRLFKQNKTGGNILIQSTGLTIRNGLTQLASLTGNALNFYNPQANIGENPLQLTIGANGALQSGNYSRGTNAKFASDGTKIDLTNGDIITKYFRVSQGLESGLTAGAYIHGTIEALSGSIGTNSTNYWEIGNGTDYNLSETAKMIGHGSSYIQLGDSSTWRLATNRIHTGWYTSGDNLLHYPLIDSKYWDFGIHIPNSDSPSGRGSDKFLYIRSVKTNSTSLTNLLYDIDDNYSTAYWDYKFWIDKDGKVHAPGFYIGNSTTPIGGGVGTVAEKLTQGYGSNTQPIYVASDGTPTAITADVGDSTTPIYMNDGVFTALNYTIAKSVPSNALFTDHITSASTTGNGNAVTSITSDANGNLTVTKGTTFLTSYTETDPTVPAWAKASNKPSYSYDEITGTVPQSALPSYVDDVVEYSGKSSFPTTGESGKIYIDTSDNKTYRWSGTTYVEISSSLALGETDSTAYRGDRGKIAYDHAYAKGSAYTSGLYKITTNSEGHVTAATAVVKKDITDLGIPSENTTYSFSANNPTLSWGAESTIGSAGGVTYKVTMPSNPNTDTKVNVSTRGTTKAYLLGVTSSPTSTKTAREAVAETGVYFDTTAATLVATTFKGNLTGTASGNLTSADLPSELPNPKSLKLQVYNGTSTSTDTTYKGGESSNSTVSVAGTNAITNISASAASGGSTTFTLTKADGSTGTFDVTVTASVATGATKLTDSSGNGINAGGATTAPVYFSSGLPVAVTSIPWSLINGAPSSYAPDLAKYNVLGGAKPWFSTTGASTLASGSANAYSNNPSINARTTTAGKYYAIEIDKNGRLFVNVPWTNENSSYLTEVTSTMVTDALGYTPYSSANPSGYTANTGTVTKITAGTGLKIGTAASGGDITSTGTINHINSVTAKTAAAQSAKTLSFGGTFTLYEEKYDAQGHVTGVDSYNMTMPANPNTHNTAYLYAGTSSGTANATTTNGNTYLILVDGGSATTRRKISGTQNVSVVSNASGDITITGPDLSTYALKTDIPSNIVNTITTTAGTHTAITSQKGNVSFNVPTKTSHLTNDSNFATMSDIPSVSNFLTWNTPEGISAKKIFAQGTSFGTVTAKASYTEKANINYDANLDAIVFSFVS